VRQHAQGANGADGARARPCSRQLPAALHGPFCATARDMQLLAGAPTL
jgi:hypothetical protein